MPPVMDKKLSPWAGGCHLLIYAVGLSLMSHICPIWIYVLCWADGKCHTILIGPLDWPFLQHHNLDIAYTSEDNQGQIE